jgi:hypothetical protein
MNKKAKGIPKFKSEDEEAAYWDSHSFADHTHDSSPALDVKFVRPVKRLISMRYDVELVGRIRRIAAWKGTPYQTLMHQWLTERMNHEWRLMASVGRRHERRPARMTKPH